MVTRTRLFALVGAAALSSAAFADILIDDFTDGARFISGSFADSNPQTDTFTDAGSMLGGDREVFYFAQNTVDDTGGFALGLGGSVAYATVAADTAIIRLGYDFAATDLSSESQLDISLLNGTTYGFGTVSMTDGSSTTATVAQDYVGDGILSFDFADFTSQGLDLTSVTDITITFDMGEFIGGPNPGVPQVNAQALTLGSVAAVPEPGTMLALGLGGALVALRRRKKQNA